MLKKNYPALTALLLTISIGFAACVGGEKPTETTTSAANTTAESATAPESTTEAVVTEATTTEATAAEAAAAANPFTAKKRIAAKLTTAKPTTTKPATTKPAATKPAATKPTTTAKPMNYDAQMKKAVADVEKAFSQMQEGLPDIGTAEVSYKETTLIYSLTMPELLEDEGLEFMSEMMSGMMDDMQEDIDAQVIEMRKAYGVPMLTLRMDIKTASGKVIFSRTFK